MDPKKFREFEERVFERIPSLPIALSFVASQFAKEPGGYGESDAKAAILGLKAQGRIELDAKGNVSRKVPQSARSPALELAKEIAADSLKDLEQAREGLRQRQGQRQTQAYTQALKALDLKAEPLTELSLLAQRIDTLRTLVHNEAFRHIRHLTFFATSVLKYGAHACGAPLPDEDLKLHVAAMREAASNFDSMIGLVGGEPLKLKFRQALLEALKIEVP